MKNIETIKDLIALWPKRQTLVEDIAALPFAPPITIHRVNKWSENGAIPSRFHYAVLLASERRGFSVTAETIIRLHAPPADASMVERAAERGAA